MAKKMIKHKHEVQKLRRNRKNMISETAGGKINIMIITLFILILIFTSFRNIRAVSHKTKAAKYRHTANYFKLQK